MMIPFTQLRRNSFKKETGWMNTISQLLSDSTNEHPPDRLLKKHLIADGMSNHE